jgi:hypothetical protein
MFRTPTNTELQRIDEGEKDYSDDKWDVCDVCGGSGESYPDQKCYYCLGKGEIKKMTIKSWIENEIRLSETQEKESCNGYIENQCRFKIGFLKDILLIFPEQALSMAVLDKIE